MRPTLVSADHELGEYLRVDEIARRFDVSVDDVLAACSVLGFPAHDAASLVEIMQFEHAVMSTPLHPHENTDGAAAASWARRVLAASAAAVLLAVVGVSLVTHGGHTGTTPPHPRAALSTKAAAAYTAKVKATYEATVDDSPTSPDYQALAQELQQITPPADLRAEHDALVAEAQKVATLAADSAPSTPDAATAANELKDDVAQLNQRAVDQLP
ncbi:MAG: hypothetical protein QOK28_898 [Actinomycetota bacterium]|jgi:hypothetical protein